MSDEVALFAMLLKLRCVHQAKEWQITGDFPLTVEYVLTHAPGIEVVKKTDWTLGKVFIFTRQLFESSSDSKAFRFRHSSIISLLLPIYECCRRDALDLSLMTIRAFVK